MKILFFHRWVGVRLGGTETHIKKIAEALAKKGHIVDILTLKGDKLSEFSFIHKVHFIKPSLFESLNSYPMKDIRVYIYTLLFMIKAVLRLLYLKIIKREYYDAVSVHFFTEAFVIRLLKSFLRWRYIFVLEGYTHLEAYEAKFADKVTSDSYAVRRRCYENFGYLPIPIPIGTDMSRFHPDGDRIEFKDKKVILSLSRIAPEKDIDVLIDAARIVLEKDQNFSFLILGDGPEREKLEEKVKRCGLENDVIFKGAVDDNLISMYYRSAHMFVVTQFPPDQVLITIADAMASGVPVIATSPLDELEILGKVGIIVPPKKPKILAQKILELGYNEALRESFKEKGLERVKQYYQWKDLLEKYVEVYEAIGLTC